MALIFCEKKNKTKHSNLHNVFIRIFKEFNFLVTSEFEIKNHLWKVASRSQPAITCSKLAIETPEQGVKYAQS